MFYSLFYPTELHAEAVVVEVFTGESDPSRQMDQICKLQSFLASALAAQTGSTGNTGFRTWPDWVISAAQQMESNISAPVETIARAAGLSYESFRKKFRAITADLTYRPNSFRPAITTSSMNPVKS